jgi:hypothetical protein
MVIYSPSITGSLSISSSGAFNNVGSANFTGSVFVSGSLDVNSGSFYVGSNNQIGVNTSSPQSQFVVAAKTGNSASVEINLNNSGYGRIFAYNRASNTAANLILNDPGGNVGIGTTTPSQSLDVASAARFFSAGNWMEFTTNVLTSLNTDGAHIRSVISTAANPTYTWKGNTNTGMYSDATNTISFSTSGSNRLTLASTGTAIFSGSVGIGNTTPNAWTSPFTVIQGGSFGQHIGFQSNAADMKLGSNNYYNGSGYVYVVTGQGAAQLNIGGTNGFGFNVAPVGTAGNTVNFTSSFGITNTGQVLVNVTSSFVNTSYKFAIDWSDAAASTNGPALRETSGNSGASLFTFFSGLNTTIGSISRNGTSAAVLYNTTSDYRLKEDLREFNGLELINRIKTYNFKWKGSDDRMIGVLSHELKEVLPFAVSGEKDATDEDGNIKPQGVDYSMIVSTLVKAIQELKAENDTLKAILQRNNIQ